MNEPAILDDVRRERRRLRVEEFELLADSGAFVDCGRTELIDGEIYVMNAQWARHGRIKGRLYVALVNRLSAIGSELLAMSETSVRIADQNMPEPDIALTRWRGDRAIPADTVALIAEISDGTLDVDLGRKAELYAAAGIPEYWVIDVNAGRVLIHAEPQGAMYAMRYQVVFGAPLTAETIPSLQIDSACLID